jgi:hypothetical protein
LARMKLGGFFGFVLVDLDFHFEQGFTAFLADGASRFVYDPACLTPDVVHESLPFLQA